MVPRRNAQVCVAKVPAIPCNSWGRPRLTQWSPIFSIKLEGRRFSRDVGGVEPEERRTRGEVSESNHVGGVEPEERRTRSEVSKSNHVWRMLSGESRICR